MIKYFEDNASIMIVVFVAWVAIISLDMNILSAVMSGIVYAVAFPLYLHA